jgi:hypothetical protein
MILFLNVNNAESTKIGNDFRKQNENVLNDMNENQFEQDSDYFCERKLPLKVKFWHILRTIFFH